MLFQVADAADGASLLACLREGGKQHGRQDGDDGNHNQQLNEGKLLLLYSNLLLTK
jgi:hypothetical protein